MDGLVKRLREVANFSESRGYSGMANTVEEAASTIEELSKLADAIPHVCECCVGCELEKKNGGCDHAFILSPKRAIQYLIKPHWIPVTERLPEDRRDVQITVFWHDAWRTMYGYYDGDFWHLYAPMHTEVADVEVIAWMEKPAPMPLPEPPKEE